MKNIIVLLLCSWILLSPMYAAEDADTQKVGATDKIEQKKAAAWYKKLLTNVKKTTAALQKVKAPKHVKRACKEVQRIDKTMPGYIRPKKKVKANEFDSEGITHRQRRELLRKSLTETQKEIVRQNKEELRRFLNLLEVERERMDEMTCSQAWCDAAVNASSEDYEIELLNTTSDIESTVSAVLSFSGCNIDDEDDSFTGSEDEEEDDEEEIVKSPPVSVKPVEDDNDAVKPIPAATKNKRGNRFRSLD